MDNFCSCQLRPPYSSGFIPSSGRQDSNYINSTTLTPGEGQPHGARCRWKLWPQRYNVCSYNPSGRVIDSTTFFLPSSASTVQKRNIQYPRGALTYLINGWKPSTLPPHPRLLPVELEKVRMVQPKKKSRGTSCLPVELTMEWKGNSDQTRRMLRTTEGSGK